MHRIRKRYHSLLGILLCIALMLGMPLHSKAYVEITTESAILMEASTGRVIFEQGADIKTSPASVTKVMTMLLTMEQIKAGNASLSDQVLVSENASKMGGSQVYLAQGEVQTLDTMLKCIAVSSGNDASVAVAEHIAGSEEAFVEKMNEKAFLLGMVNTHFVDCCGLTDSDDHYTTARDVAIMSRELITKYPEIYGYTQIWMEDITHVTKQGESRFGLSSTNKLLKQYQYTTGLKTGCTGKAKYCLSATARKDGIDLIAVVLGSESSKIRFSEAQTLLTYGFGTVKLYVDENQEKLQDLPIVGGLEDRVPIRYEGEFRYVDTEGRKLDSVEKRLELPEKVDAPVKTGEQAGEAVYYLEGKKIGSVPILYDRDMERAGYVDYLKKTLCFFLL